MSSPSLAVASPNGGKITAPTASGDPGSYLKISGTGNKVTGSTLLFTLAPSGVISLSSLTFNYNTLGSSGSEINNINWSITSGGSGTITSSTLTYSKNVWQTAGAVNLSGITLTSGNIVISGTLTGPGGNANNGGTIGFDNLVVTAVPEPVNYALAGFGLLFVVGSVGRFYLVRARS